MIFKGYILSKLLHGLIQGGGGGGGVGGLGV